MAHARAAWAAATDAGLALLIMLSAMVAWAPRIGLAAVRETLAARRSVRAELAEICRTRSEVWARQARRNALARRSHAALRRLPGLHP